MAGPLGTDGPKVNLRGASKAQASSQAILDQAKAQRRERHIAREQPKAAVKIQRAWRGYRARHALYEGWKMQWVQIYGPSVADSTTLIPPQRLLSHLLPLALLAYLPPGGYRAAIEDGAQLHVRGNTALRGALALLLRSLSASESENNYLHLATVPETRSQLVSQLHRITILCCAIQGGASGSYALTQAAGARILGLICDLASWTGRGSLLDDDYGAAVEYIKFHVLGSLKQRAVVAEAARRVAQDLGHIMIDNGDAPAKKAAAAAARKQKMSTLQSLILSQLTLWQLKSTGNGPEGQQTALKYFVVQVLTVPGVSSSLTQTATAKITKEDTFTAVTDAIQSHVGELAVDESLYLLANLAALLAASPGQPQLAPCSQAAQALLHHCLHLVQSGHGRLHQRGEAAVSEAITVFGQGGLAVRLLNTLSLNAFCTLYRSLLQLTDSMGSSINGQQGGRQDALRLLSALAFATGLLPLLWKQLALDIGLPLEIPAQASRWLVPSLVTGAKGLPPHQAHALALFCRTYSHYLAVVDDVDFHEQQALFSLSQQRAIAASINTLVFKTHVPETTTAGGATLKGKRLAPPDHVLLQHAPRLLRALFERDARKRFCSPELWLRPYASAKCDVSGAAVLRALRQRHGHVDEEEERTASTAGGRARSVPGSDGSGVGEVSGLSELLLQAPQCIPFEARVAVFRGLIALDKEARRLNLAPIEGGPHPIRVIIRRTHVLEDALTRLLPAGGAIRGPLSITFINNQGLEEAGIDRGGLTKELLETVASAVFDPDRGLFTPTVDGSLHPHPLARMQPSGSDLLCLAGVILGRALYDGVLLDAPLAPFFVSALQGRLPTLDDLAALDHEVHRGLISLKRYQGNAEDLGLDFSVESCVFGARITEDLIFNGSNIPVTNANKLQFVHCMADWHLRRRVGPAAVAFSKGLSRVIPPSWLRLFSPREVNQLLGGGEGGNIDITDMKMHAHYAGGYSGSSRTVQLFWKVLKSMSQEERRAVLKFATSCGRAPLGGFAHLNPPFTIHKVDCGGSRLALFGVGPDVERLPSASTCSNTLKLPNYKREATLREKLLYAVKSGAGFELS